MKPKLRALVQTTTAEGGTHSQHRLAWPPYASQTRTGLPRRHPQDQNTSAERQFFSLSAVFGPTPGPPHARRREQMSIVPTPTPRHAIRPHSSPIQISPRPARQPPRLQVHRHRPHARRTFFFFFLPPPFPPTHQDGQRRAGSGPRRSNHGIPSPPTSIPVGTSSRAAGKVLKWDRWMVRFSGE